MKKPIFLVFILITTLLYCSCTKKNGYKTNVSGIVSNKLTFKGEQGIPVSLIGCSFSGSSEKCLETIKTVYTDINGFYSIGVNSDEWKHYKIAVDNNDKLADVPYPYYYEVKTGADNLINFSQFPIKKLMAHVIVKKHNKNWLDLSIGNNDSYSFYSADLFHNTNPIVDFDSTYIFNIEAGRSYSIYASLSDRTAPYTNINYEYFNQNFSVSNIDTTFMDFVFQ